MEPGAQAQPQRLGGRGRAAWSVSEQVPCSKGETRRELPSNERQPLEQPLLRNYPAD